MLPFPFTFCASFSHGPRQIWAVQVLKRAVASAGLSQKEAAACLGLTEPQWSRQCSCEDGAHVSYQRIFEFPAAVLKALIKDICQDIDLVCFDQPDVRDLVQTNRELVETNRLLLRALEAQARDERRSA